QERPLRDAALSSSVAPADTARLRAELDSLKALVKEQQDLLNAEVAEQARIAKAWTNPYTVTIGANFDLLDGIDPNGLYTSVEVFRPTLRTIRLSNRVRRNIGFTADLTRGRTISIDSIGRALSLSTDLYNGRDTVTTVTQHFR